jgi:hypothetical protein
MKENILEGKQTVFTSRRGVLASLLALGALSQAQDATTIPPSLFFGDASTLK